MIKNSQSNKQRHGHVKGIIIFKLNYTSFLSECITAITVSSHANLLCLVKASCNKNTMTTSSRSKCAILRTLLNWGSQIYTLMSDLTWIGYGAIPFCMPAVIRDYHFLFFDLFNSANAPNPIFINCFCFPAF